MKWDWAASQADRADLDSVDCQCSESLELIKERGSHYRMKNGFADNREIQPLNECWTNSCTNVSLLIGTQKLFWGVAEDISSSLYQSPQSILYVS